MDFLTPLFADVCPTISDEDFKLFHNVDRKLYSRLVNTLGRDPSESIQVMAFWQWLEQAGRDMSLVTKIVALHPSIINDVADETLMCLKCVEDDKFFFMAGHHELVLIPSLLSSKFNLKYFHENRDRAILGISSFIKQVCIRAFDDIVQQLPKRASTRDHMVAQNVSQNVPQNVMGPSNIPIVDNKVEEIGMQRMLQGGGGSGGMVYGMPYYVPSPIQYHVTPLGLGGSMNMPPPQVLHQTPYGYYQVNPSNIGSGLVPVNPQPPILESTYHEYGGGEQNLVMHNDIAELLRNSLNLNINVEEEREVPPDDRTVFLTFSKGYPITETEVREFFTRRFGDHVEAIHMQEVPEDEQVLYARLVVRSLAALDAMVDGGKAKYNINGKHVWARKYVKKPNPKYFADGQSGSPAASTSNLN